MKFHIGGKSQKSVTYYLNWPLHVYFFQITNNVENGHEEYSNGKVEEKLKQWSKEGKKAEKFDHTWMGLGLLALPTRHFGWDGITKTMKVVRTNWVLSYVKYLQNCVTEEKQLYGHSNPAQPISALKLLTSKW